MQEERRRRTWEPQTFLPWKTSVYGIQLLRHGRGNPDTDQCWSLRTAVAHAQADGAVFRPDGVCGDVVDMFRVRPRTSTKSYGARGPATSHRAARPLRPGHQPEDGRGTRHHDSADCPLSGDQGDPVEKTGQFEGRINRVLCWPSPRRTSACRRRRPAPLVPRIIEVIFPLRCTVNARILLVNLLQSSRVRLLGEVDSASLPLKSKWGSQFWYLGVDQQYPPVFPTGWRLLLQGQS